MPLLAHRINALHALGLACLLAALLTYFVLHDPIYCTVSGAGLAAANGYYTPFGGAYAKRGGDPDTPTPPPPSFLSFQPDIYQIYAFYRDTSSRSSIHLQHLGQWAITASASTVPHTRPAIVYTNSPPLDQKEYIYYPPPSNWQADPSFVPPIVVTPANSGGIPWVHTNQPLTLSPPPTLHCRGSLADSPPSAPTKLDNFSALLATPVNTALLVVIFAYAYQLWTARTG